MSGRGGGQFDHLGRHVGFFKNFIFSKAAASFLEIIRIHVLYASENVIIKNKVEKKKLYQIFSKSYNFLVQTLI